MTVEHIREVLELGEEVFDTSVFPYSTWSLGAIAKHLDRQPDACWIALSDGIVVGSVLGSMSFFDRPDWGHIEWIMIKPGYQGRTLAARLSGAGEQALWDAGATRVVADIETSNRLSRLLAHTRGYREMATMSLFAKDGETTS